MPDKQINPKNCTDKVTTAYPHVGLFDVQTQEAWIARKRWNISPVRVSHARLLLGGTQDTSTADKDKFLCFWFHTPGSGEGYVQGYPIEWDEGHLLVRFDPRWNYATRELIPATDTAKIEANIDRQYAWGQRLFNAYKACEPKFAISWHMTGPRPTDSMFYIERYEA